MNPFINSRTVTTAVKALGVMLLIIALVLFVGTSALGDGAFGFIMFVAFVLVFWLCAFIDGLVKGQEEAKLADRLYSAAQRAGRELDGDEKGRVFSISKGIGVTVMLALPGIVLAVLSALTLDGNTSIRVATRIYFTPYLRLLTADISPAHSCLLYIVFALCYPLVYFAGYAYGPKAHARIKNQLRQNEEDYKKGIRRRRPPSKRRRGFFG